MPEPLGGFGERARTLLRDIALQATVDIVRSRGWARTRMSDIAVLAGISRPTLYKYFGSKEQLAREYVDREVDSILGVVRGVLERYPNDPERALREGLHEILKNLSRNPLIGAIFTDDAAAASLLPLVTIHGERLLNRAVIDFAEIIDPIFEGFEPEDVRAYADTMVRALISHAILPSASVDDSVDTMLRTTLPLLRQRSVPAEPLLNDERKSE